MKNLLSILIGAAIVYIVLEWKVGNLSFGPSASAATSTGLPQASASLNAGGPTNIGVNTLLPGAEPSPIAVSPQPVVACVGCTSNALLPPNAVTPQPIVKNPIYAPAPKAPLASISLLGETTGSAWVTPSHSFVS